MSEESERHEYDPRGIEFFSNGQRMKLITDGPWKGWICYRNPDNTNWVSLREASVDDSKRIAQAFEGLLQ